MKYEHCKIERIPAVVDLCKLNNYTGNLDIMDPFASILINKTAAID